MNKYLKLLTLSGGLIGAIAPTAIDINNNKQLILNTLPISKIENLQESLNNKVDAQAGYTLLSPDDQKKLAALVIGEDNNLEISGSVNADNVQGLEEWLNKNAGTMPGLSENNLTDELYTKLNDSLFISSIDTSQLSVTAGKLSILEIDQSKITGLVEALNVKTNQSDFENLQIIVSEVQNSLADYVLKAQYDEDIADIYDRLTWKDI